jgi:octaprenyl-diphosphate synthase
LVGDYLLSRGLLLTVNNEDFDFLKIISQSVREMSEGELLQIAKARLLDIAEDVYFEIIRKKTASLIASCCAVGARSATTDQDIIDKAKLFGEKVGIAFQIKDDLFDYGNAEVGKPLGIDIKEKKMTLPLIYALRKSSWLTKRKMINIIKNKSHKSKKVQEVIAFVKESGGIEYAQEKMKMYQMEANEILASFPDNIHRKALADLVKFTIERSK